MAVTLQSHSSTTLGSNSPTVVVAKPTGLVAGDLLIAHYSISDPGSMATLSGWTHEVNNQQLGSANLKTGLQWKIADSGDAAASNFTFSGTETLSEATVALLRIDGFVSSDFLNESTSQVSNTTTPTFTNTITPLSTGSLLLFFVYSDGAGGVGASNFAIANDNPTWNTLYNLFAASNTLVTACGYATRTTAAATGNSSCSVGSGGTGDPRGILVSISQAVSVTATPALLSGTFNIPVPTPNSGNTATPALLSATFSALAPTISPILLKPWSNQTKSSVVSATNQTKNASTVTNQAKNSSSVVNQQKDV